MHLFFDLDGTLTDSCTGIIRCVNHALEEIGCAREPDDRLRGMIGQPLTSIFGTILGAPDDTIDRAIAAYRVRFDAVGIFENALYPGVAGALERFRLRGFRLQVVTAKPAITASRVLGHFGIARHFAAVHGPELTDRGCDKGVLVGRALAFAGAPAAGSIMIGDRVDDVLAAKAQRVRAVGAGWGYGRPGELLDAGAEYVAPDPEALAVYLCR
jgi:phosphoglycolate phosphatase